ncbi:hypothetical protein [Prescottella equi]|uniref:Uncharacterized protein n=1 Tax=Rhodococcus hoagii TaxID=43767 RepID=A0AAE5MKR0_RHOHA|nr:hypothetical protein [Prescottella equi]ORM31288.1 hypothetical protein A5N68_03525 [Prescottella equi]BDC71046.1 hypothetical protein KAREA_09610 [Prescottella equi]
MASSKPRRKRIVVGQRIGDGSLDQEVEVFEGTHLVGVQWFGASWTPGEPMPEHVRRRVVPDSDVHLPHDVPISRPAYV